MEIDFAKYVFGKTKKLWETIMGVFDSWDGVFGLQEAEAILAGESLT